MRVVGLLVRVLCHAILLVGNIILCSRNTRRTGSFRDGRTYGGGAGGSIGFSVRYQGELLGIYGTFKIVILVENHPQKPKNRLADYHPIDGWGS